MAIRYDNKGIIKRPDAKVQLTKEQLAEYVNAAKSPEYFAEKYYTIIAKHGKEIIKLRDFQRRMLKAFISNQMNIAKVGRQSGKTVVVCVYVLWYCFFNKDKTVALLAHKADQAKSALSDIKTAYENIPVWMKPGIKEYNAFSIEFDNGCKILAKATHPNALRGETCNLVICLGGENTVKIRNKITGEIKEISLEQLYKDSNII